MCRWLAYSGSPILLEELLSKPAHSLIDQSMHARQGATTTNGDGFGVGWYLDGRTPGVFRAVGPAWSDRNLRELAGHVASPLFMAHIRASTRHGRPGDQLPPLPPRPLAVGPQRPHPGVPPRQTRPGLGGRPVTVPGDRGVGRL